jgi:hypothetical protein
MARRCATCSFGVRCLSELWPVLARALTDTPLRIYNSERPSRLPRPSTAAHVSAEAFVNRQVSLHCLVTGNLTE